MGCPCVFVENSIWGEKTDLYKIPSLPILPIGVTSCSIKFKIKVIAVRCCNGLLVHVINCIRHNILLSTRCNIIIAYGTLIKSGIGSSCSFKDEYIVIVIGSECHELYTWNKKNHYQPIDDVYTLNEECNLECLFLQMLVCNLLDLQVRIQEALRSIATDSEKWRKVRII